MSERMAGGDTTLAKSVHTDGILTRRGPPIDKGDIYKTLNDRVYIGEAVHKGSHPGEHQAIIDHSLRDKAHAILRKNQEALHRDVVQAVALAAQGRRYPSRGKDLAIARHDSRPARTPGTGDTPRCSSTNPNAGTGFCLICRSDALREALRSCHAVAITEQPQVQG